MRNMSFILAFLVSTFAADSAYADQMPIKEQYLNILVCNRLQSNAMRLNKDPNGPKFRAQRKAMDKSLGGLLDMQKVLKINKEQVFKDMFEMKMSGSEFERRKKRCIAADAFVP